MSVYWSRIWRACAVTAFNCDWRIALFPPGRSCEIEDWSLLRCPAEGVLRRPRPFGCPASDTGGDVGPEAWRSRQLCPAVIPQMNCENYSIFWRALEKWFRLATTRSRKRHICTDAVTFPRQAQVRNNGRFLSRLTLSWSGVSGSGRCLQKNCNGDHSTPSGDPGGEKEPEKHSVYSTPHLPVAHRHSMTCGRSREQLASTHSALPPVS